MPSALRIIRRTSGLGLRALLVTLVLAAPVLAVPSGGTGERFLEQPPLKGSGIGLVLLVSLQRA